MLPRRVLRWAMEESSSHSSNRPIGRSEIGVAGNSEVEEALEALVLEERARRAGLAALDEEDTFT